MSTEFLDSNISPVWSNKKTAPDIFLVREGGRIVARRCSSERTRLRVGELQKNRVIGKFRSLERAFNSLFPR